MPVIPRRRKYDHKPIVAVGTNEFFYENTQETLDNSFLPVFLKNAPSCIVAVNDAPDLVGKLHTIFKDDIKIHERKRKNGQTYYVREGWQIKAPLRKKRQFNPATGKQSKHAIQETIGISFFGWTDQHGNNNYHIPLDPLSWGIDATTLTGDDNEIPSLFWFAQDVRAFCEREQIKISASGPGLAGQLLRDPRFWPQERRKVPRATNDKIRPHLPGNYYDLKAKPHTPFNAIEIDMSNAHHRVAATLQTPNSDGLYARGSFRKSIDNEAEPTTPRYSAGSPVYTNLLTGYGCHLFVGNVPENCQLPGFHASGRRFYIAFTNEIPTLQKAGIQCEGIQASWVSFTFDEGINRYAEFALSQIAQYPESKSWLKPMLHSVYGLLASTPRQVQNAWANTTKENKVYVQLGSHGVELNQSITTKEFEPSYANVITRGMIEAQVRLEVMEYATALDNAGFNVLSVRADGILIEDSGTLPTIPDGWRVKQRLTNLRFQDRVSYTSDQEDKLPGRASGHRARLSGFARLRNAREVFDIYEAVNASWAKSKDFSSSLDNGANPDNVVVVGREPYITPQIRDSSSAREIGECPSDTYKQLPMEV